MNIVVITESGKFGFNFSGGDSVVTALLWRLIALDHKVSLVRILRKGVDKDDAFEEKAFVEEFNQYRTSRDVFNRLKEVIGQQVKILLEPSHPVATKDVVSRIQAVTRRVSNPAFGINDYANAENAEILAEKLRQIGPDLIIANHLLPSALLCIKPSIGSWVTVHHDWISRLLFKKLGRTPKLSQLARLIFLRYGERRITKSADGVICVSEREKREIENRGQPRTLLFPPFYPSVETKEIRILSKRLYHFGGMSTTANRIGLEVFLGEMWKSVLSRPEFSECELVLVGDVSNPGIKLTRLFAESERVKSLGRVEDVETLFKPFELQLIPYPGRTGVRTKIPFLMRLSQVLLVHENSIKDLEGLESGVNCLTYASPNEFLDALNRLFSDKQLRVSLGSCARILFEEKFSLESSWPRLEVFLDALGNEPNVMKFPGK